MQLPQLELKSNLSPRWGAGHHYAQNQNGERFEVLIAEPHSESTTNLISWAHSLERVGHPAVPIVHTITNHTQTYVSLKIEDGVSLAHLIKSTHGSLNRFDIVSIFYQIATMLQKLHQHGLTHGNLLPDYIFLKPNGEIQLHGWAPPSMQIDFQLRQVDDLKLFQTYFYFCIVGDFPPKNRGRRPGVDTPLPADEKRKHETWSHWYRAELERGEGSLSGFKLLLFQAPPQNAEEIIESLHPFLDHYMYDLLDQLNQEILDRLSFRELISQRKKLQKNLIDIQRHIRHWLSTHQDDAFLCDEQINKLTALFKSGLSFQSRLEGLGGMGLERSREISHEGFTEGERVSPTSLYVAHNPKKPSISSLSHSSSETNQSLDHKTFLIGNTVIQLSDSWKSRELSDPFLDVLHLPSIPPLQELNHYNSSGAYLSNPPISSEDIAFDNADELSVQSYEYYNHSPTQNFDPNPHHNIHAQKEHPNSSTFLRRSTSEKHSQLHTGFLPAQTHTAFTNLYEPISPYPLNEKVIRVLGFSRKNFFFFLYAVSGLIFFWYIYADNSFKSSITPQFSEFSQRSSHIRPKMISLTSGLSSSLPTGLHQSHSNKKTPPHKKDFDQLAKTSPTPTKFNQAVDLQKQSNQTPISSEKESSKKQPKKTSPKEIVEETTIEHEEFPMIPITLPPSPDKMVYVMGGEVHDSLDKKAYNLAITHCVYAPRLKKRAPSKDLCKRYIKKSERAHKILKVDPFFMDIYEVSRGDYAQYCADGGICNQREVVSKKEQKLPMVNVTMLEASDYCAHYGKRLPKYTEWLYAARADTQALYPWGNQSIIEGKSYRANYKSPRRKKRELDGYNGPHNVDEMTELGMSPFKVAHLGGNVREWVFKLKRNSGWVTGGGWRSRLWDLRLTAGKYYDRYRTSSDDIGFRCAKNIIP